MKITKLQLKQLIKEELGRVLLEVEEVKAMAPVISAMSHGKAILDPISKQAVAMTPKKAKIGPLRQFIKDNPEAGDYFGAGSIAVRESDPPIDPKWMEESARAETSWFVIRYKSMKEKKIADDFFAKIDQRAPYTKIEGGAYSSIGVHTFDGPVQSKTTDIFNTGNNADRKYEKGATTSISHSIAKVYFHPKETLKNYIKEYGKERGYSFYKQTSDQLESIVGKPIPNSGRVYLYSYLAINAFVSAVQHGKMNKDDVKRFKSSKKQLNLD